MIEGYCDLCSDFALLTLIHKQIAGKFKAMHVCPSCLRKHEEDLERTRQNFQAQVDTYYGGK